MLLLLFGGPIPPFTEVTKKRRQDRLFSRDQAKGRTGVGGIRLVLGAVGSRGACRFHGSVVRIGLEVHRQPRGSKHRSSCLEAVEPLAVRVRRIDPRCDEQFDAGEGIADRWAGVVVARR